MINQKNNLFNFKFLLLFLLALSVTQIFRLFIMFVKICLLLSLLLLVQTKYEPKLAKELVTMCSISNEPAINIDKWNCTECKKYKMLNVKAYT